MILYIGSFFESSREEEIWNNSKSWIVVPGNIFQKSLIDGFQLYPTSIDSIINIPALGSFPLRYRKLWFPSSKFTIGTIKGINGGFLNLTVAKNYSIYTSIKRHALRWAKTNINCKKVIIVYSLIEPYLKAAIAIKKKYPETQICCIVLDLPQYFDDSNSLIRIVLNRYTTKSIYNLVSYVDSFILLTEPMAINLEIQGKKPWILLEGLYSPRERKILTKERKTILYTGKLDARFGIVDMIEAFKQIPDKDYRLWICGDGSDRQIVEKATKYDHRIKYFGLLKQDEILSMQTQATLLLNPRKGNEEYTKYSFPSKTMEYMASGTPTVMYPLDGVPNDYKDYLILIPDNTNDTLKNIMVEWCEKPQEVLDSFGNKAKQFILHNKTSAIQASRILKFIKGTSYE